MNTLMNYMNYIKNIRKLAQNKNRRNFLLGSHFLAHFFKVLYTISVKTGNDYDRKNSRTEVVIFPISRSLRVVLVFFSD